MCCSGGCTSRRVTSIMSLSHNYGALSPSIPGAYTVADLRGAQGAMAPPPRCQRWHLNNPSTAKSRQLLGDFVPQTPYRASTPGPRWWPPELAPSKFIFWIRPCTESLSSIFHLDTTRWEKKYFLISLLHRHLTSFNECPRVLPVESIWNISVNGIAEKPWAILKTSIKYARFRRSSKVHSPMKFL